MDTLCRDERVNARADGWMCEDREQKRQEARLG